MLSANVSSISAAQAVVGYMPMPASFSHKKAFLHGRPQHQKYDDFWLRHPPMSSGHRAKIFAPFDALRGFDFCIMSKEVQYTEQRELSEAEKELLDEQLRTLQALTGNGPAARKNRPAAEITFFESCTDPENFAFGKGGQYKTVTGCVSRVDPLISRNITVDGMNISLDTVSEICIL